MPASVSGGGGTLAAWLNTPLAPAGIAGGDHGVGVHVREVVYQEHNTCFLLGSRPGHSEPGCGDCGDTRQLIVPQFKQFLGKRGKKNTLNKLFHVNS